MDGDRIGSILRANPRVRFSEWVMEPSQWDGVPLGQGAL
jgi:hypothetical protein